MRSPKSRATPRGGPETGGGNGGEFAAIDRLRRRLPGPPAGEVWIGDDAAVLGPGPGPLLLTTDLSVAGVHADLALIGLDDLGWRALAAAVSDVAAMGGRPDGRRGGRGRAPRHGSGPALRRHRGRVGGARLPRRGRGSLQREPSWWWP